MTAQAVEDLFVGLNQLQDCGDAYCAVHRFGANVQDWWPQGVMADSVHGTFWKFYIRFTNGGGKHHEWIVCKEHHDWFWAMWTTEFAWDVAVMEASDLWMASQGT